MSVQVSSVELKTAKQEMKGLLRRVKNPNRAWRRVGSYLAMVNRKQFATEGGYHGKPWKPLQPDYLQWKIRSGYSRKTLVQTGAMKASFTSRPMSIEKYYGKFAVYGSDNELAKYHQYGTHRNGKRAIPPRPIMLATRRVKRGIRNIVQDYLAGKDKPVRSYM